MSTSIIKRIVGVVAAVAMALGISAVAATPASAATVWDKVAKCESGGRWHINTGNGYYGGLQFSGSTWRAHGGKKYAKSAHKASKAEQIAIARRVLASQGAGAWPSCGRRAHLTKSNGKANRHATPSTNPGAKKHKKKSSAKVSSTSAKVSSSASSSVKHVKVKSGDTLAKIAKRYHVKGGWKALWKLNKAKLKNPNHLKVGMVLKIKK